VVGASVVVGTSVVVGGRVVVGASVVVAANVVAVVVDASAVGAGRPDNVIGGGMVCADADEPFCEHDETASAKTGRASSNDWGAARRFIARRF